MKKSILFFCILSFVFIVPFTYADSTKIASIIPHDPIIKKIYPLNRMNVMLNGSKGRVWLSRASFFGYLDNNDYLYDYTEVTSNSWRVTTDFNPIKDPIYTFNNLQEDKPGNIIAYNQYGVGWFDGRNWRCMLHDQYKYVKNLDIRAYHVTKDAINLTSYYKETYRFPYDATTNTYLPLAETDYSERFNDPNACIFPYYNEPYEDGNYYKLGESAVKDGYNSNASFHVVHNKETGKAEGYIVCATETNEWNDSIDFHTNLSDIAEIKSLYLHDKYGYYRHGCIINENPAVADTGYYPVVFIQSPWHEEYSKEIASTYPIPFPRTKCTTSPSILVFNCSSRRNEGQSLYYICGELLHYNASTQEWKRISTPQAMLDNGDDFGNMIFDMIQPTCDEIWISGYHGIYVCDIDALLASAKPTSVKGIKWVLPKLGFRNVYPNPSTNRTVTAEIACYDRNLSPIEIGLYNQIGQKLLDLSKSYSHNSATNAINLTFTVPQNIPSGIYYLTVRTGKEQTTQAIVIADY